MIPPLSPKGKMEKAIGLASIANDVKKLGESGASPMEQQTFANAARRELARQRPDPEKMEDAASAASLYKQRSGQEPGRFGYKDQAGLGQPGSPYS